MKIELLSGSLTNFKTMPGIFNGSACGPKHAQNSPCAGKGEPRTRKGIRGRQTKLGSSDEVACA